MAVHVTNQDRPKPSGADVGQWAPQEDGVVATKSSQQIKRPRLFRVLLHNDDYTTMEFVVMVLMTLFHHTEPSAVSVMLRVHKQGAGLAGVYTFEVAEARIQKVTRLAREHEFPLRCSMEPDDDHP
jgi:ATP-dependent Clp protease adaptor protein ClpS